MAVADADHDTNRGVERRSAERQPAAQPVEHYDGSLGVSSAFVATHQAPVGQLRWNHGPAGGSGTMISDDLLLTSGHLFDNGLGPTPPQEIARQLHVRFDFQLDRSGQPRRERCFPVAELLEHRSGGLDMAILRIGGFPGACYGRTPLATQDAAQAGLLCRIGHPDGSPKRVQTARAAGIDGALLRYRGLGEPGHDAGAGLLDGASGRLVGLHGGHDAHGGFGPRIEALIAASPILRAHAAGAPCPVEQGARGGWVAVPAAGRLHLLRLGPERQVLHTFWDGRSRPPAGGWTSLGGCCSSAPAAVAHEGDRLEVFAIGSDGQMLHKDWDGRRWWPSETGWTPLGGLFSTPPVVLARGPQGLDVFGRGADGQLLYKHWNGRAWWPSDTGWQALGGVLAGTPTAVVRDAQRLDVFALGADGQLFRKAWDGRAWLPSDTGWEPLGGRFGSTPIALARGSERIDLYGNAPDGEVLHKVWDDGHWWPSAQGWERPGGTST